MVRSDLITEGHAGAASIAAAHLPAGLLLDARAGWLFQERAPRTRMFVHGELARGSDLEHYALRSVDRRAEARAGRPADFEPARRSPADAFTELAPGHAAAPLPEPLARATEAAQVVTAPERRAEHFGWPGEPGQARAVAGDIAAEALPRPGAYLVLGLMAMRTGDEAQAERLLWHALELDPHDDQA